MARNKNTEEVLETAEVAEASSLVEKLMKLYPQYDKLYISKNGFVYPEGASERLVKDATLYTNKYFTNNN